MDEALEVVGLPLVLHQDELVGCQGVDPVAFEELGALEEVPGVIAPRVGELQVEQSCSGAKKKKNANMIKMDI